MTGPEESRGQRMHRRIWTVGWTLAAVVGAAVALIGLGWINTLGCAVLAAGVTVAWYCTDFRRSRAPQHRLTSTLATGIVVGVAVAGWGVVVGLVALLLPAAALATMPGLGHWLTRPSVGAPQPSAPTRSASRFPLTDRTSRRRPVTDSSAAEVAPPPPGPQRRVQDLTDAELCQAWRTSYITLDRLIRTPHTAHQATWVERRQQYLDELERRHPAGFRRWLHSGARPASDPSRYLRPTSPSPTQPSPRDHPPTGRTP